MTVPPDPARAVLIACGALLGPLDAATSRCEAWSSATFSGARYTLGFRATPRPDFAALLADVDIPLRRSFVADAAVTRCAESGDRADYTIEVLVIDEA